MKVTETVRIMLIKRGNISEAELARRVAMSPQNFNRKLKNEVFSVEDLQKVAKALDCSLNISFTFNDTGEVMTVPQSS